MTKTDTWPRNKQWLFAGSAAYAKERRLRPCRYQQLAYLPLELWLLCGNKLFADMLEVQHLIFGKITVLPRWWIRVNHSRMFYSLCNFLCWTKPLGWRYDCSTVWHSYILRYQEFTRQWREHYTFTSLRVFIMLNGLTQPLTQFWMQTTERFQFRLLFYLAVTLRWILYWEELLAWQPFSFLFGTLPTLPANTSSTLPPSYQPSLPACGSEFAYTLQVNLQQAITHLFPKCFIDNYNHLY